MNAPLSYTDPQTIDAISVITGVTPVSMGGDRLGGAISVETPTPRFATGVQPFLPRGLSAFYRRHGDGFGGPLSFTALSDGLSLTYAVSFTHPAQHNHRAHQPQ